MSGELQTSKLEAQLADRLRAANENGTKTKGCTEYKRIFGHFLPSGTQPETDSVDDATAASIHLKIADQVLKQLAIILGEQRIGGSSADSKPKPKRLLSVIDSLGSRLISLAESHKAPYFFIDDPKDTQLKLGAFLLSRACELEPAPVLIRGPKNSRQSKASRLGYVVEPNRDMLQVSTRLRTPVWSEIEQKLSWAQVPSDYRWSAFRGLKRQAEFTIDTLMPERKDQFLPPENVIQALNHLQSTAWRINLPIYEALKRVEANERHLLLGGFASPADPNYGTEMAKHESLLDLARQLGTETFNLAYRLDFRGRVYVSTGISGVNPQGRDWEKAILKFSKPVRLGPQGWKWLCVNLFNYSNKPAQHSTFDKRQAWVEHHRDQIESFATAPLSNEGRNFWAETAHKKKRWRFLAACQEVCSAWKHQDTFGDLESFESALPVSVDGVCNGYQHMSALLRDAKTAKSTNVLRDKQEPHDFYADIAKEICKNGEKITIKNAESLVEEAVNELGEPLKLFRERIEQVTKVVSKLESTVYWQTPDHWLIRSYRERQGESVRDFSEFEGVKLALYPHQFKKKPTGKVNPKKRLEPRDFVKNILVPFGYGSLVREIKKKLKKKFKEINSENVEQKIPKEKRSAKMSDRIRLIYRDYSPLRDKVSKGSVGKSLLANFIHSLDATLLHRTVNVAADTSIDSLLVVHDSFGTQAGKMEELHQILLTQFTELYRETPLRAFIKFYRDRLDWLKTWHYQRKHDLKLSEERIKQLQDLLSELEQCIGPDQDWFQEGKEVSPYLFS